MLELGGVTTEPPAGVVAGVGEEGAGAGLAGGALGVGLEAFVFEWSEHDLRDLDGIVTAAMACTNVPDGPVAGPEEEDGGEEGEESVGEEFLPVAEHGTGWIVAVSSRDDEYHRPAALLRLNLAD